VCVGVYVGGKVGVSITFLIIGSSSSSASCLHTDISHTITVYHDLLTLRLLKRASLTRAATEA